MGVIWNVGDKIGVASQRQPPRVLMRPGVVTEVHDNGVTVQWPGEKAPLRYRWGAGMEVEHVA